MKSVFWLKFLVAFAIWTDPAKALSLQQGPAEAPSKEIREVEVIGRGPSQEDAKRNARSLALDLAIGALVDTETRVSKDEVIEEVISASAGFIERFEVVGEGSNKDGSAYVRAKVQVRANLLRERLTLEKVVSAKVDGTSIFAKAISQKEGAEGAAMLLARCLVDYPLKTMEVALVGEPEVVDSSNDVWPVGIQVEVRFNDEAWTSTAQAMREVLAVCAKERFTWQPFHQSRDDIHKFSQKIHVKAYQGQWSDWGEPASDKQVGRVLLTDDARHELLQHVAEASRESDCIIAVPIASDIQALHECYVVPRIMALELARLSSRRITLHVTLVDQQGDVVKASSLPVPVTPVPWRLSMEGDDGRAHGASPRFMDVGGQGGSVGNKRLNDVVVQEFAWLPNGLVLEYLRRQFSPFELRGTSLGGNGGLLAKAFQLRIAIDIPKQDVERVASVKLALKSEGREILVALQRRRGLELEGIMLKSDGQGQSK